MDLNYLKRLLRIFDESSATELEIEEEGLNLRIAKSFDKSMVTIQQPQPANTQFIHQAVMPASIAEAAPETQAKPVLAEVVTSVESSLHHINSPIVGTFYRSPSPDSAPFCDVGSHVNTGQTLCIIEAMKLMNEIESDISGTIEKILVQNAQPVDYNQPLFIVKPD